MKSMLLGGAGFRDGGFRCCNGMHSVLLGIDCVGALVTSFVTFFVLASEWIPTGLPRSVLVVMSIIAFCFACIDLAGILFSVDGRFPLALIAILNTLYVVGTLVLCAIYFRSLTLLGGAYFFVEAAVVLVLAGWEWRSSRRAGARSEA